jgi:hypothetical protein
MEYIASRKAGANAAGDFLRLARADAALPEIATEAQLLAYVQTKSGPSWTSETARSVWHDYRERVRNAQRT